MVRRRSLGFLVVPLLLALSFGAGGAAAGPAPSTPNPIKDCLEKTKGARLAVLFNLDESSSLKKSDPDDRRVDATKTAIAALAANLRSAAADADDNPIDIATSGFAKKFDDHGNDWTALTSGSVAQLIAEADEFSDREETPYTDYEEALKGAERKFVEYDRMHPEAQNCKVLVWFSDGSLDVDNRSGDSKPEEKKKSELCRKESGVVDRLRSQDVFIVGFGLRAGGGKTDFDLMSKITEGGCGSREGLGAFTEVDSADALIQEMFKNLFGSTTDPLQPCADDPSNTDCREVVFRVRPPLDRINALVSITSQIETASVVAPGGKAVVFASNGVAQQKSEDFLVSTPSFDLSTVLGLKVSGRTGEWKIRFEGPGAKYASVFSAFFSDLVVDVEGAPLERDKKKLEPIFVSIGKTDISGLETGSSVLDFDSPPTIEVELIANGVLKRLPVTEVTPGSGRFSVRLDETTAAGLPGLVSLRFTPAAAISGHQIEFTATSVPLTLRLGDGFPVVKGISVTNVDGGSSSKVTVSLGGPEEGQGTATIVGGSLKVDEVPADQKKDSAALKTGGQSTRKLSPGGTGEIVAEISPGFEANGKFSGSLSVLLENDRGEEQAVELSFTFNMTKPFDTSDFLLTLIVLLVVFVLVQGAIFFAAADRLSRIGVVPGGTWYARFDVVVKDDDSVVLEHPASWDDIAKFHAQPVDPSQVSRKRTATFESFRFFGTRSQGLRSLLSAGDTSVMVDSGGAVLVASGASGGDDPRVGRVRPTLAGQWAAAVAADTAIRVAEAAAGVPASTTAVEDDPWKREFSGGFDAPESSARPEIRASVLYFFKDFNPALPEGLGYLVEETLQYARIRDALALVGAGLIAAAAPDEGEPAKGKKRRKKDSGPAPSGATIEPPTADTVRDMYG